MSDTDSAVLPYALPDHQVGNGIGQMKLVHKINSGIFIRKKLYALIDSNGNEIIKSSGIDPNKLNYNSFLTLLKGESITISGTRFNVEWKDLNINVIETNSKVRGLSGLSERLKTIYNTPDVNYKVISFPIKYDLIIHPMFPYFESVVNIRKTKPEIITKESDFFLIFSKLEIIFFFILLFFSFTFILIYIYFFKI